jgi:hypothetical protein
MALMIALQRLRPVAGAVSTRAPVWNGAAGCEAAVRAEIDSRWLLSHFSDHHAE